MKAEEAFHMTEEAQTREMESKRNDLKPVLDRVYELIRLAANEGKSHVDIEFADGSRVLSDPAFTVRADREERYWVARILESDGFKLGRVSNSPHKGRISWDQA